MLKRFGACATRIIIALAVLGACHAQTAAPAPVKPRHILMWKASSPTTTVYLLGSIHVGTKEMYPLPEAIESAFASSKALAVEVNVKKIDQIQLFQLVRQYGVYSGDDALSKHLPKETADALSDFSSKHGLPMVALDKMKPWVAAITVLAFALQQAGQDPALGIDMHFLDEVKQPQRVEELENADFQLRVFSSATEKEQVELLGAMLRQADKAKDSIAKMQNAWLAGDSDGLLKMFHEENEGPQSLMKKLIDDRNVTMAEHVDGFLKSKEPYFVVVGAGHIIGDKGIVRLLQNKGYKVELVPTEVN